MIEPFFGTGSPTWQGMSPPALGWPQVAPVGYRTVAAAPTLSNPLPTHSAPGVMAPRLPAAGPISPIDVSGFGAVPLALGQPGFFGPGLAGGFYPGFSPFGIGPLSGFVAPEVAANFSLPAFLSAVAVKRGQ